MRKFLTILILLIVAAVAAWYCHMQCGGVMHGELKDAIEDESAAILSRIDERYKALDAKLDRIEAKIDKLIDMATPKFPDGMKVTE